MFHVFSGLTFIFLIWYGVRLQTKLRWNRQLWEANRKPAFVHVDWPENFFRNLGDAWGIDVECDTLKLPPQKIALTAWLQAYTDLTISKIVSTGPDSCRIFVNRNCDIVRWQKDLEAAMQNKIHLTLDLIASDAGSRSL